MRPRLKWMASLQWVDENLDFETLVIGHPPVSGTKEKVGQVRMYLEDLIASVEAAQSEGLANNSPEVIAAVRADLEADYGAWANFDEWLRLNVEGLIRAQSAPEATPAP